MKVIKTLKLGLLYRTFEENNRCFLATSLLGFFPFPSAAPDGPKPTLHTEIDLWKYAGEELGTATPLDVGMPKPRGEVLITGKFFPPNGQPAAAGHVGFELGGIRKQLYVFGDRFWKRNPAGAWVITDPRPMATLDISYQNAFGGVGYARNPLGKGASAVQLESGVSLLPLPNVEDPRQLIGDPQDRREPSGFGPLDLTWPQRFSKSGTYDQTWLSERFPGFAADMDWSIFNTAPEDQQNQGFFAGDEAFTLEHMHPQKPLIQSRLPGVRPRCFMNRTPGGEGDFSEIATRLDTVWLFPHSEKGLVVFRGVAEVADADADDVLHLLVAYERLGDELRPPAHYRQALLNRLDPEKGQYYSLSEKDLIPPGEKSGLAQLVDESADAKLQAGENILSKRMTDKAQREAADARARLQALGLDPEARTGDTPKEVPEFDVEDIDAVIDQLDGILAQAQRTEAENRERLKALFEASGMDYEQTVAYAQTKGGGRPPFAPEETIARLKELGLDNPEMEQKIFDTRAKLDEAYRQYGHLFPAATLPPRDEALRLRRTVLAGRENRASFSGWDLTGADLSGLDLKGVDLRNAFLEGADLSGCDLEGADLGGCVLVRARVDKARFVAARMQGANLGGCRIVDTDFTAADLGQAVLAKAQIRNAVFVDTVLEEADLSEATILESDFGRAKMPKTRFMTTALSTVDFTEANLSEGLFLNATLSETNFTRANLTAAIFVGLQCSGVRFTGARLVNLRTATENRFGRADLREADLTGANLRGMDLAHMQLDGADLSKADLSRCNLQGASLRESRARGTQFVKADLTGADLQGIDLFEGSLQKARLFETDIRGANLYGVDFMKAQFRNTDLRDSFLKKVFLERWIPKNQ